MKVKIQQFLFGASHSWAVCGKNIARALIKKNHDVDLFSTNGHEEKYWDSDLKKYTKSKIDQKYDLQFSYTAPKNFPSYLNVGYGGKRIGMWAYEFDCLPKGFPKYMKTIDKFCSPSNFFHEICLKSGVPKSNLQVMPHGVDWDLFQNAQPLSLKTKKSVKILVNFAQPHIRKNISGTLKAFGKAFNKNDDVCLVLKVKDTKKKYAFDLCFSEEFLKFKKAFPNAAETLVLNEYIPGIESLYKSCDILFMIPNAEAFFFPALEMLASGGIVITSRYGGQLDYLNDNNSILVDGKMVRAPMQAQYWTASPYSSMFEPSIDDAVEKLRDVVLNISRYKSLEKPDQEMKNKFSWENNVKILESFV